MSDPMQDLYGKVTFTAEEISNMQLALDQYGLAMPSFKKIGGILAEELPYDEAAVHAAIIAINDALQHQGMLIILIRNGFRFREESRLKLEGN